MELKSLNLKSLKLNKQIITLTLVVLLGVFLQVIFVFADMQDTPYRAVIEFTKGYAKFDEAQMTYRMCQDQLVVDDINVVKEYLYNAKQEAEKLGYSMWYMKDGLHDLKTETVYSGHDKARVRIQCTLECGLRSFFGGDTREIDETIDVIKEDGRWKVCGNVISQLNS